MIYPHVKEGDILPVVWWTINCRLTEPRAAFERLHYYILEVFWHHFDRFRHRRQTAGHQRLQSALDFGLQCLMLSRPKNRLRPQHSFDLHCATHDSNHLVHIPLLKTFVFNMELSLSNILIILSGHVTTNLREPEPI